MRRCVTVDHAPRRHRGRRATPPGPGPQVRPDGGRRLGGGATQRCEHPVDLRVGRRRDVFDAVEHRHELVDETAREPPREGARQTRIGEVVRGERRTMRRRRTCRRRAQERRTRLHCNGAHAGAATVSSGVAMPPPRAAARRRPRGSGSRRSGRGSLGRGRRAGRTCDDRQRQGPGRRGNPSPVRRRCARRRGIDGGPQRGTRRMQRGDVGVGRQPERERHDVDRMRDEPRDLRGVVSSSHDGSPSSTSKRSATGCIFARSDARAAASVLCGPAMKRLTPAATPAS